VRSVLGAEITAMQSRVCFCSKQTRLQQYAVRQSTGFYHCTTTAGSERRCMTHQRSQTTRSLWHQCYEICTGYLFSIASPTNCVFCRIVVDLLLLCCKTNQQSTTNINKCSLSFNEHRHFQMETENVSFSTCVLCILTVYWSPVT